MIRNTHEDLLNELEKYETISIEEENSKSQTIKFLRTNDIVFGTKNIEGHVTASAWIVNKERSKVLMTHHKILDIWIQLGGHTDEGETPYQAGLREGYEESGLKNINEIEKSIFDIDVHYFPETKNKKAHYHYDFRYIFEADEKDEIIVSNESKDVKWISFNELEKYTSETALFRMREKSRSSKANS